MTYIAWNDVEFKISSPGCLGVTFSLELEITVRIKVRIRVRIHDYEITCMLRGPWLVNTHVSIRVSKHGNCRLQKIGKINVHDVNKCFNFDANITSMKSMKYLRTNKD